MRRQRRCFGVIAALTFLSTGVFAADWSVEPFAAYNKIFHTQRGWIGADGDYSVTLTNDTVLWLFSDTFIGEVRDGKRVNARMINNSVALQHGKDPARTTVQFFYGKSPDGKPAALITPADGRGWFWLYDGVLTKRGLFLFLMQIERSGGNSVFDFKHIGTWLGHVPNPFDPPTQWRVTQKRIPHETFSPEETRLFGSAVLKEGGFVYIYGVAEPKGKGKSMILARVPEGKLDDFSQWRFFDRTNWVAHHTNAAPICPNIANEYSVSYQPSLGKYILIYTENGLSPKILARQSDKPFGPWGNPIKVYQCPEASWGGIFFFFPHPQPGFSAGPGRINLAYGFDPNGRRGGGARTYFLGFF